MKTPGQKLAEAMKATGLPYTEVKVTITPEMKRTDKWIREYIRLSNEASKNAKNAKIVFRGC